MASSIDPKSLELINFDVNLKSRKVAAVIMAFDGGFIGKSILRNLLSQQTTLSYLHKCAQGIYI